MFHIAIIDGFIDKIQLIHSYRIKEQIMITSTDWDYVDYSHATMIAKILDILSVEFDIEYDIINIIILHKDYSANVSDYTRALKYCLNKSIDIVILSIGSIIPSDALVMYSFIQELCNNGTIILASQSNNGKLTFPASFNEVIGIQRDYCGLLPSNGFTICPHSLFNINITINCKQILDNLSIPYRNSFAVPVVAAHLCKTLKQSNQNNCFEYLKQGTNYSTVVTDYFPIPDKSDSQSCKVCICLSEKNSDLPHLLLRSLNLKQNIHTLGVFQRYEMNQPCWFQLQENMSIYRQIDLLEAYSLIDLLLIACTPNELDIFLRTLDIDIVLRIDKQRITWQIDERLIQSNYFDSVDTDSIATQIYTFLS